MKRLSAHKALFVLTIFVAAVFASSAQPSAAQPDEKADAILAKAVQNLGGDKYLKVTSQIGTGKFSVIRDGTVISFQKFVDVIVFPEPVACARIPWNAFAFHAFKAAR